MGMANELDVEEGCTRTLGTLQAAEWRRVG